MRDEDRQALVMGYCVVLRRLALLQILILNGLSSIRIGQPVSLADLGYEAVTRSPRRVMHVPGEAPAMLRSALSRSSDL
jgi:hypothetical protein